MNIRLHPYQLEFIFPFRIAHGVRTHTDALFVELELDGVTAFGEATFPPYLPYNQKESISLLSQIDLRGIPSYFDPAKVISNIKQQYPAINPPAYAALDMVLWFLKAKLEKTTVQSLLGINSIDTAPRSYTISVCGKDEMTMRVNHGLANGFSFFKLKLDGQHDRQMLSDFRSITALPFAVDANQSWTDLNGAIGFAKELEQAGCVLIEQPFHKDDIIHTKQLGAALSIPIIADEACQGIDDIDKLAGYFSGVNIKLQKCGGITPALEMINYARSKGLKVLIGCMSESIIGCTAGEVLSPLCDWNDLDGSYLVKEVPFRN